MPSLRRSQSKDGNVLSTTEKYYNKHKNALIWEREKGEDMQVGIQAISHFKIENKKCEYLYLRIWVRSL